jgi:hypothetical protein
VLPLALSSYFDKEEVEGDEHNIHTMQGEVAVVRQSLRDGCQEVEWLKECLAVAETTLSATDGEAADARAAVTATRTEFVGELNFYAFFAELLFVFILTLRASQQHRSSWALSWLRRQIFGGPTRSWPTS